MKLPKEMKRFCRKCKTHTLHKVKQEKNKGKNKSHPMTKFSQIRMKLRGLTTGLGNMGARSRKAINAWKRFNKKHSKKMDIRFICSKCNYTSCGGTKRTKKFSIE
jgi:ribosomal protein L44E